MPRSLRDHKSRRALLPLFGEIEVERAWLRAASPAMEETQIPLTQGRRNSFPTRFSFLICEEPLQNPLSCIVLRKQTQEANRFLRLREPHHGGLSEEKQSCFTGHLSCGFPCI